MLVVVQRVTEASVQVKGAYIAQIEKGLLILLGIVPDDTIADINWLVRKILNLRIFSDENQVMNNSVQDIDGDIIVVSQFTLHASTKKGNRPSYLKAAKPDIAIPLYELFKKTMALEFGKPIQAGIFGADMKVSLINDGPVTIIIDSKNKL